MRRLAVIIGAFALAALPACSGCDGAGAADDEPGPDSTFDQCTSEPAAFVRDAMLAILGRRPASQHEVDAYVALYEQVDATDDDPREVVARAMLARPEKLERWAVHVMDVLRVPRIESQRMSTCYGVSGASTVSEELALYVRDNAATAGGPGRDFTMLDLVKSAIALDDLSPIYRGHLFALVAHAIPAANVPAVQAELARREDFGNTFDQTYLNRDIVCLGCHNSSGAVTDREEPELDRHWPLAGHVDTALYGMSTGIESERAHAPFRYSGFVLDENGFTPWGMSRSCGQFRDPSAVGDDIAMIDGYFASLRGKRLTAFDLEAALKRGFETVRGTGLVVDAEGGVADPDAAFAYMVATTIAEGVWREAVGSPLTIANYFPRNQAMRDQLQRITDRFVTSGYSLDELLVAVVTSDYFSRRPPESGCGPNPYTYPAVFDPWVIDDADPVRHGNGPGDAVAAVSPRTLVSAAYAGLEWSTPVREQFPMDEERCEGQSCSQLSVECNFGECCETYAVQCQGEPATLDPEELPFQRAIGAFIKNGERGFRGLDFQARLAWEDRFGVCKKPMRVTGQDLVDRAIAAGTTTSGATVGDVVAVVKDRLVGEPVDTAGDEPAAIAALLGQPLDAPAANLTPAALRRFCGVVMSSPQFVLGGVAGRGGAPGRITLAGDGFDDACAKIAAATIPGWTVTCGSGSLSATRAPSP